MSAQNAPLSTPTPLKLKRPSGFNTVLRYTGIPASWLDKRLKLPSRNWLIFFSVTSTITGYYVYDRRQCKHIKQHYINLVREQAEELVDSLAWPRKVTVYGSKWPGDEDYDQGIKYFRKYVKPVLVAAAVDFEMISGRRHGDVAERVAEDIRQRRRSELGIDPVPEIFKALPTYKPLVEVAKHRLEGGTVIIGRPTLKEFMVGLKRGWTDGLEKVDHEELLARELEFDGRFDEAMELSEDTHIHSSGKQLDIPNTRSAGVFSHLNIRPTPSTNAVITTSSIPDSLNAPPPSIPPIPPLLLVSFTDHIGLSQIPIMIWEWFNQRHKVRSGAEAGYRLVMNYTRPIHPPAGEQPPSMFDGISPTSPSAQSDLDFDKEVETWYKKSLSKIPSDVEKARKKYYEELPARLATARELARGTREPTKEEVNNPPPTEVELRAERMKKELRWRRDIAGWGIIKPSQNVEWDKRFRDTLRIFIDRDANSDLSTHS